MFQWRATEGAFFLSIEKKLDRWLASIAPPRVESTVSTSQFFGTKDEVTRKLFIFCVFRT